MTSTPDIHEWNLQTVALSQALLGAVSPNFRQVALDRRDEEWSLHFVLERDDPIDREEIEDVVTQFEAVQEGPIPLSVEVAVDAGDLAWPEAPARTVFRRRES